MQIQTIFASMLAIREEQGRPPYGLCYEFECTSEYLFNVNYNSDHAWADFIQDQFPQWYSNNRAFPIASSECVLWYSGSQAFPIVSSECVSPGDAYRYEQKRNTQEPTEYSTRRLTILQRACELAHLFELIETTPNQITLSYVGVRA